MHQEPSGCRHVQFATVGWHWLAVCGPGSCTDWQGRRPRVHQVQKATLSLVMHSTYQVWPSVIHLPKWRDQGEINRVRPLTFRLLSLPLTIIVDLISLDCLEMRSSYTWVPTLLDGKMIWRSCHMANDSVKDVSSFIKNLASHLHWANFMIKRGTNC